MEYLVCVLNRADGDQCECGQGYEVRSRAALARCTRSLLLASADNRDSRVDPSNRFNLGRVSHSDDC